MSFKTEPEVERKILSILKVLGGSQEPVGSRIIARKLKDLGVELGERAIRYHLKLTDERGLTYLIGNRDGRKITDKGMQEINRAMVQDKVGYAISRIEVLAFRTDFDIEKASGNVPVNVTFFPEDKFADALRVMTPSFEKGLCVSRLVRAASAGERMGDITVPENCAGLATVCSIVVNGTLLKAGIPMDSRFGGILQIKDSVPGRFTEIIHYDGCSLDPSEIFIKARMTTVSQSLSTDEGEILANFREIPAICRPTAERVIEGLKKAGMDGVLIMGNTSETVCQVSVELNKIGLVLVGGLNPVAAAFEAGIESEIHSMSTVLDYASLTPFADIYSKYFKKSQAKFSD